MRSQARTGSAMMRRSCCQLSGRIRGRRSHMAGIVKKSFGSADEVRTPDKTRMEVVDLGGVKAARMTLEPGWRWSDCIKPIAGTASCQTHHVGTVVSGSMHIVHDDGTEQDLAAG